MSDRKTLYPIPLPRVEAIAFPALPRMPEREGRPAPGLVRLNLNEAPMPPSPRALEAARLALAESHRYPDHHAVALTGRIAARTGVSAERIVFGNGSGELLVQCARPSLAAACAAFDDVAYMRDAVARTVARRETLRRGLEALGVGVLPSFANFLTLRFAGRFTGRFEGCSVGAAAPMAKALADRGIAVQALGWPDSQGSLRITIGSETDIAGVLSCIQSELAAV